MSILRHFFPLSIVLYIKEYYEGGATVLSRQDFIRVSIEINLSKES